MKCSKLIVSVFVSLANLAWAEANGTQQNMSASCLNSVFEEVFVISIGTRTSTLAITLQQLEQESISYTLWEGHSASNPHSTELFDAFTRQCPYCRRMNKVVFFLRQTQIDILKYAKRNKRKKILILEDDIVLANPSLIQMFCEIEPNLPKWDVLGLGVNQERDLQKVYKTMQNVPNHETKFMKYWQRTYLSWGLFAIAFSEQFYDPLLAQFDYETSGRCTSMPIDQLNEMAGSKGWPENINIYPTLVLPDVTESTHDAKYIEADWIKRKTLIGNADNFSKYYGLRFPVRNESKEWKKSLDPHHPFNLLRYGIKTQHQATNNTFVGQK